MLPAEMTLFCRLLSFNRFGKTWFVVKRRLNIAGDPINNSINCLYIA